MDTHVRTPQEIFLQPQHLVVPPFQRAYVWNKEEQWAPLWQDVRSLAEDRLTGNPPATHFLGAVVLQAQQPVPGAIQAVGVVDGQQRLTTLQLLMDAAASVLDEQGEERLAEQLDVLTHNQAMYVPHGSSRLKLRHSNRDRAAFDEVMDAEPPVDHTALQHSGSLLARAHEFFVGVLRDWLAVEDGADARAAVLVDVLTRGLQMVAINLGAQENSQEIFETLNARGTPLTAADLIKNHVFQRLEAEGVDVRRAYAEQWIFDTPFWETEVAVGRYPITRGSLFFNQWLISRTGEEIGPKATFTRFKRHVDVEAGRPLRELLPVINAQAATYRQWLEAADDPHRQLSRTEMNVYRMKASEVGVLTPLLIWLHDPARAVPAAAVDRAISAAESWLVRRQLLRLPSGDLGRVVAEIIRVHAQAPAADLGSLIEAHLARLNVASTYWPGDEELRRVLHTEPVYRRLRRGRLRILLEAVENHHRSGTGQPQVPRSGYPIEHVMPQAWQANWPVAEPDAEPQRDAHIHRLGNLTLLTTSLNSKVSNASWEVKRQALQRHDTLLLNSRLLAATAHAPWTEHGIDDRTGRLLEAVCAVWPVPPGHVGEVAEPQAKAPAWIQLKHLVDANLLAVGDTLIPRPGKGDHLRAVIRESGLLDIDGAIFEAPSPAAGHVRGTATNGWTFWRLPDGRRLQDVRAQFTGQKPGATTFDWSNLHVLLEALPSGRWTSYLSLADAVGTSPQPLGTHIAGCPQCVNAHRVLRSDGTIAPGFAWTDPDDHTHPGDLLRAEGVAFHGERADPSHELSADDLVTLVGL